MNESNQSTIVLFAMQALKADGSWCGETHVQKTLFLCQEVMGVSSNFKFILYKHGPYSFELSEHLQGLIADELVHVLARAPYGPSLNVSDEGRPIAAGFEKDDDTAARISFMSKKVSRKNVAELEKIATAVYVNRKHGTEISIEKRAGILSSLKPHVSVEAAREAFVEADAIENEARNVTCTNQVLHQHESGGC